MFCFTSADRDHFEYWHRHLIPEVGIVFDPETEQAGWVDITQYLESNPNVIESGPYAIPISCQCVFSEDTFADFMHYFLRCRDNYQGEANFGRSLEHFADVSNIDRCLVGLESLFRNHRNRSATWYYLVNSYPSIELKEILCQLAIILCHIPGHGDIFWHKRNIIDESTRHHAELLIAKTFGRQDVVSLLGLVDEAGFERGSIGQCVHAIVSLLPKRTELLESIAFDSQISDSMRYDALLLLIYEIQWYSKADTLGLIGRYIDSYPTAECTDLVMEISSIIDEHGYLSYY